MDDWMIYENHEMRPLTQTWCLCPFPKDWVPGQDCVMGNAVECGSILDWWVCH